MASIAIIAAKELQEKVNIANTKTSELKASNHSLKKQLADRQKHLVEQQKRLSSLEKLVENLASANGHFRHLGEKVVTIR